MKLDKLLAKVQAYSAKVFRLLHNYAAVAKHALAPSYFPELALSYVCKWISQVEEWTKDLLEVLCVQIKAGHQVEHGLLSPPVPPAGDAPPVTHSTPDMEEEVPLKDTYETKVTEFLDSARLGTAEVASKRQVALSAALAGATRELLQLSLIHI